MLDKRSWVWTTIFHFYFLIGLLNYFFPYHSERKYWNGLLTGIRKTKENNVKPKPPSEELPFNVIMFGLDSLSRNAFIRKLPRTYKYMTDELKADVLQSYNIVGDGTPQALIPVRNVNLWIFRENVIIELKQLLSLFIAPHRLHWIGITWNSEAN